MDKVKYPLFELIETAFCFIKSETSFVNKVEWSNSICISLLCKRLQVTSCCLESLLSFDCDLLLYLSTLNKSTCYLMHMRFTSNKTMLCFVFVDVFFELVATTVHQAFESQAVL